MSERYLHAVLSACKSLHESGRAPSTALIKSKLSVNVPLPEIIRGLKYWQADPHGSEKLLDKTFKTQSTKPLSSAQEIASLKRRVQALETALIDLQTEVKALNK